MAETAINIDQAIAQQGWIDQAADRVQEVVHPIVHRAPAVASVLHGHWLGHPLHAALTDIPVGGWFTAQVLDCIEVFGHTRRFRRAADTAHLVGLVGAMAAAVAGLADWSTTRGGAKRVGFVHGATNMVVAGLYVGSLVARKNGRRRFGIALSSVGYGMVLFSSWLGGELSYRHGVGVKSAAVDEEVGVLDRGDGSGSRSFMDTIDRSGV